MHRFTILFSALGLVFGQTQANLDLHAPIGTAEPTLENIVNPFGAVSKNMTAPIHTNKFYFNALFNAGTGSTGKSDFPVFADPYVVRPNGSQPSFAILANEKFTFGKERPGFGVEFYVALPDDNLIVSSEGLKGPLSVKQDVHGLDATLTWGTNASSITSHVVRGMAYVSALFKNASVSITSPAAVVSFKKGKEGHVYTLELNNKQTWYIFVFGKGELTYKRGKISSSGPFNGWIRFAKVPAGSSNDVNLLAKHAGTVVTGGEYKLVDATGYSFSWSTVSASHGTTAGPLLHFSYIHHLPVLGSSVKKTRLQMLSTTKGLMTAVIGSKWALKEKEVPQFDYLPKADVDLSVVKETLAEDIAAVSKEPIHASKYFHGKQCQKLAMLCLVADRLKQKNETTACLKKLSEWLTSTATGKVQYPLVYDTRYGGVITTFGVKENKPIEDFGNPSYNDHHYHYGYFVYSAAVLSKLNPKLLSAEIKEMISLMLRDVVNPSTKDKYFPIFRHFDFWSGHSYSQGIFSNGDGKDQESTSEEVNFMIGMLHYAQQIKNPAMEATAKLMLSIAKRTINTYFLMKKDNTVHPKEFIPNKVTGIYFQNKAHHTTWFGPNIEYIHGIQMLPMTPALHFIRDRKFDFEEWDVIGKHVLGLTGDGPTKWKSMIMMSYANIDGKGALGVVSKLAANQVDDGLTRTWARYWAASQAKGGINVKPVAPSQISSSSPATAPVAGQVVAAPVLDSSQINSMPVSQSSSSSPATAPVTGQVVAAPVLGSSQISSMPVAPKPISLNPVKPASVPNTQGTASALTCSNECSARLSIGDKAIGLRVVSDPSCSAGGLGCMGQCRFCKIAGSTSTVEFVKCPPCAV